MEFMYTVDATIRTVPNYPFEIQKTRQFTEIRDRAIWAARIGQGTRLFFDDDAPGNSRLSSGWKFVGTPEPCFGKKSLIREGKGNTQVVVDRFRYPQVTDREEVFRVGIFGSQKSPKQIMIQFHNGNWEHRAFWGQNLIPYGIDGTTGRRRMGIYG